MQGALIENAGGASRTEAGHPQPGFGQVDFASRSRGKVHFTLSPITVRAKHPQPLCYNEFPEFDQTPN